MSKTQKFWLYAALALFTTVVLSAILHFAADIDMGTAIGAAAAVVGLVLALIPTLLTARPEPLARLAVLAGPARGQTFLLRSKVQTIGRSDGSNHLLRGDELVSNPHARLEQIDGVWYITDLDSRNGVWIDGERIGTRFPVPADGEIRIGRSLVRLDEA